LRCSYLRHPVEYMQGSKENNRFFTDTLRRNGFQPTEIHKFLVTAWGNAAPSFRTICRYHHDFGSGDRHVLTDAKRSGRPTCSITNENIEKVRLAVGDDCHITIS